MITQDVKNPKLQGLGGLIIVLCILLAIFLAVILSALARPLVGALASSLFVWLVGGCVALYVTRRFVSNSAIAWTRAACAWSACMASGRALCWNFRWTAF